MPQDPEIPHRPLTASPQTGRQPVPVQARPDLKDEAAHLDETANLDQADDESDGPGLTLEPPEALPAWSELSLARRQAILEALIFGAEQPIGLKDLRAILGVPRPDLLALIEQIREDLQRHNRGLTLEEVAGGYVFRTRTELAPWLRALIRIRPPRLSRAALECLAIVAYRQPATRADVEQVRGVDSGSILRALLEKRLIRILGRKEDVGRPMIYGTTRDFLQLFGLKDLTALPTLRDLNALMGRTQGPAPRGEGEMGALDSPQPDAADLLTEEAEAPDLEPPDPGSELEDLEALEVEGSDSRPEPDDREALDPDASID